jgi:hypothetical protein
MSAKNQDKYKTVCTGDQKRFAEKGPDPDSCKSYLTSEKQCRAVKERRLAEAFEKEKGRCLIVLMDMIDDITGKNIRRNPHVYVDREESEDVDIESLVKTLGNATLDHYTIADWHNYMYWLAKRRVLSKMIRRGVARKDPKKPKCGTCIYRSLFKPHGCCFTDEPKLKGDIACSAYVFRSGKREDWAVADKKEGPHYREELFEESMPDQETMGSLGFGVEERMQADELYDLLEAALQKRILDAKTPGKQGEYTDEHLLFREMMELMSKGHSESDAKAELVKSVETENKRDSVRRWIDRHWDNIQDFLRKECKKLGIDLDEYMFPKAHRKEKAT